MPAQGEAISSVSENSRNPGYPNESRSPNPNGVALTFSGKRSVPNLTMAGDFWCCQWCGQVLWL